MSKIVVKTRDSIKRTLQYEARMKYHSTSTLAVDMQRGKWTVRF